MTKSECRMTINAEDHRDLQNLWLEAKELRLIFCDLEKQANRMTKHE